jgi:DME family drug/metabolite transporter
MDRWREAGLAMALASAVLFATYTLLSEELQASYGTFGAMFRAFVAASVFWIAFQTPRGVPTALFRPENLPEVLFVGLGGTLAAFILYVWGIGHVRSERAAIAATLEPVMGGMVAYLWLGQALTPVQIAGGALVIAAVVMLQTRRREIARAPEP